MTVPGGDSRVMATWESRANGPHLLGFFETFFLEDSFDCSAAKGDFLF